METIINSFIYNFNCFRKLRVEFADINYFSTTFKEELGMMTLDIQRKF